jgi:hypothetical protein
MSRDLTVRAGALSAAQVVGYIDVIAVRRISGWAWDENDPSRRLEVEIRFDGRPIASVRADRPRKDLASAGVGDGGYGFETLHETRIGEADYHRVSAVVRLEDGNTVTLDNRVARALRNSVLTPEDVSVIREAIESWPTEQRLLVDQLAQRLLPIAGELQRLRGAIESPQPAASGGLTEAVAELRRSHEALERRLSEIDGFHGRFDQALAALETEKEARAAQPADRSLRRMVTLLAIVSGLSLIAGLASLFR